jgi:hypothetical protein
MSDWQTELEKAWGNVVAGLTELGNEVQQAWQELEEFIAVEVEQIAEEMESIVLELKDLNEEIWQDLREDGLDFFDLENGSHDVDWSLYAEPTRPATADHQPACMGCGNYSGTNFGGNLLVCGFHPYGWAEGNCPDWEKSERD